MGSLSAPPHPPCPPLLLLMEGGAAETGVPGGEVGGSGQPSIASPQSTHPPDPA